MARGDKALEGKDSKALPYRIMVVDDEPDVLESTAMILDSLGMTAITRSRADGIAAAVASEHPDVLLQDLSMPGLDVDRLMDDLRKDPRTAKVPVVFFSAHPDLPTVAARHDSWGYLTKPFEVRDLAVLLDQALQGRQRDQQEVPLTVDRAEMEATFISYWNLLAALGNYLAIVATQEEAPQHVRKALNGMGETLMKLQSRTDALHRKLMPTAGDDARRDEHQTH